MRGERDRGVAVDQAAQQRVIARVLDRGAVHRRQRGSDAAVLQALDLGPGERAPLLEGPLEHRFEQLFLAVEMDVDQGLRDPGGAGDLLDRGPGVPELGEAAAGGLENAAAGAFGAVGEVRVAGCGAVMT